MDAQAAWRLWHKKGAKTLLVAAVSALIFGTVDSFTSRLIPAIVDRIDEALHPSTFLLRFGTPVVLTPADIKISPAGAATLLPVRSVTAIRAQVQGPPGNYDVSLKRMSAGEDEILNTLVSVPASDVVVSVDTADAQWTAIAALIKDFGSDAPTALRLTRFTAAPADWDWVKALPADLPRDVIAAALHEVGVSENDNADRITVYWKAAGLSVHPDNHLFGLWNASFVAFAVRHAGLQPPSGSAATNGWQVWGQAQASDKAAPGSIAVFKRGTNRRIVGIILRRRPDCLELILGNITNKVVISCIPGPPEAIRSPI